MTEIEIAIFVLGALLGVVGGVTIYLCFHARSLGEKVSALEDYFSIGYVDSSYGGEYITQGYGLMSSLKENLNKKSK